MNIHPILQHVTKLILITWLITSCNGSRKAPQTGFVEIDGINVYYEKLGEGPSLILIHGGNLDSRMWDDQFEAFAEQYQVIRYDIPGFGKSEPPTSVYSNVEILSGLLTTLNIEQAHILGLSLGGRIAIDYTLQYPHQVMSLILVAPGLSGYRFSAEVTERINKIIIVGATEGSQKAAEMWLEDPYMTPAMENPAISERVRQLALDNAEFWVRPYPEQPPAMPSTTRLNEIHVPTLIIVGDRDVKDIYAIVDMLDSDIISSQKEVIAGAGHIVNMEKPIDFNRIVLTFLMNLNP